jgi:hypothetical protein
MPSVVRLEILNDEEFPWHVEKGHAGWVGNSEAKKRPPLFVTFVYFILIVVGAFAPTRRMTITGQLQSRNPQVSGV